MKDKENNPFDEYRQFDDLFREGLSDLHPEPSRDLWKGISRKLWWDEISHFTFTNLSSLLWIGGFAGLALIVSIGIIASIPESAVTNGLYIQSFNNPSNSTFAQFRSAITGSSPTNALLAQNNNRKSETEPKEEMTPQSLSSTNKFTASSLVIPSSNLSGSTGEDYSSNNELNSSSSQNSKNNNHAEENLSLSYIQPLSSFLPLTSIDTIKIITPQTILNVPRINNNSVSRFFTADMGISPDVAIYKNGEKQSEVNFYGTAGIAYHVGRFSVRSGVGLGYVFSDGVYRVDYKSKDSVGFYNTVISYGISQANPNQIIYITKQTVVYDSITHIADDRTRNRYTYLQFPLMAGFRLLETHRIGLTIETGPMVSFLIGTKEALPALEFQNAKIIRLDKNTPDRKKINWQVYLGIRFDLQFTKEFSLYAQPYYKYYFSSIVRQKEKPQSNPYSFGIGLGILYHFGRTQ